MLPAVYLEDFAEAFAFCFSLHLLLALTAWSFLPLGTKICNAFLHILEQLPNQANFIRLTGQGRSVVPERDTELPQDCFQIIDALATFSHVRGG